ncbi:MAG: hypothetical protein M1818_000074 [Claussenomyces sp. TS43310]|nr:MAG: hypothetical protein M1818_000074 [Claussenomyces sp. TS43310]
MSPVYRGLTLQFKVFLQMSGMVTGGMLDADSRLRAYELRVRMQRKIANDRANREHYEREYDEPEYRPPPKNDK